MGSRAMQRAHFCVRTRRQELHAVCRVDEEGCRAPGRGSWHCHRQDIDDNGPLWQSSYVRKRTRQGCGAPLDRGSSLVWRQACVLHCRALCGAHAEIRRMFTVQHHHRSSVPAQDSERQVCIHASVVHQHPAPASHCSHGCKQSPRRHTFLNRVLGNDWGNRQTRN